MNNNITFSPKVATAFVRFQGMVRPIKKTKTVNMGGYSYAYCELSAMVEAIQDDMKACGLSFYQKVSTTDDKVTVITYLLHESGEHTAGGEFSLKIKDHHPQKMGALLSFCRRYSLQTALGLTVCDEDTDCCNEVPTKEEPQTKTVEKQEPKRNLDAFSKLAEENSRYEGRAKQLRRFHAIMAEKGCNDTYSIRAVIFRFTSGKCNQRRSLTEQQLLTLNTLLENSTPSEIAKIIDSVREKMAQTA